MSDRRCPMCKEREADAGWRCSPCQAVIDERWESIERNLFNDAWQDGGVEAVQKTELELRTCDNCGHEHETAKFIECIVCGTQRTLKSIGSIAAAWKEIRERFL